MSNWLVVGLGNPGAQYEHSRHNVGADAIEAMAQRHHLSLRKERGLFARVVTSDIAGARVTLAVPETFMNESGRALAPLCRRYVANDIALLVVVHDELDLAPGTVRVKSDGGTAGHNGLRSTEEHLRSLAFQRVRIGIGKPPGQMGGADYVLARPRGEEKKTIDVAIEVAVDAIEALIGDGLEAAMNAFNSR